MSDQNYYKGGNTLLDRLLVFIGCFFLRLRYKIVMKGLEEIQAKGKEKIFFLPNHTAAIDPVVVYLSLHQKFPRLRAIGAEELLSAEPIHTVSRRLGTRLIPDMTIPDGREMKEELRETFEESIAGLENGENLILYPSGRLKRQQKEVIGGTTGTAFITNQAKDIRIVLLRQNGLWGSSFSWGVGEKPNFMKRLLHGIRCLFVNFLFFMPRRKIEIEFVEPDDFPAAEKSTVINRYLEDFYNQNNQANTYVPYYFWQGSKPKIMPEPQVVTIKGEIKDVPESTQKLVKEYLEELTGVANIRPGQSLSYDLGMDSLALSETTAWIEKEFGFPQVDTDSYRTVQDLMLGAVGQSVSSLLDEIKPVSPKWYKRGNKPEELFPHSSDNLLKAVLSQARKYPKKLIFADQQSGEKSFRNLITGFFALGPHLRKIEGDKLGIMFPASVGAGVFYFAALFAEKTPVMVNWTTGIRNVVFSLTNVGVQKIITSRKLVQKLESQGVQLDEIKPMFIYAEDFATKITLGQKLRALWKTTFSWSELDKVANKVKADDTAVILFTSGSESKPKSVPLTHQNILTNCRDVVTAIPVFTSDNVLGVLPPFHSFGLVATIIIPITSALPAVYYANPTEARMIAKIAEVYHATFFITTPTFLQAIIRVASPQQLESLRVIITGAEKCSEKLYDEVQSMCPKAKVLEGYGVTECSPVVSVNEEKSPVPYSIGKILTTLEYEIVHVDTFEPRPQGESGLLLLRGPSIFGGYLNYEGKSPFVKHRDVKWYNTGDLVYEDENKTIFFSGRLKRFIKLGGEMVSLPAIEEALLPFLGTGEEGPIFAVEANPDAANIELVLFAVEDVDRAEINEKIRDSGLSSLHNIRQIRKVSEIPLLGTGKTNYRALRDMLKDE